MLARCQLNIDEHGACRAMLRYPVKGYPWRRNICRKYDFTLDEKTTALLFAEVFRIKRDFPEACLSSEETWSDTSEKANNISRDRASNTLCYTIGVISGDWAVREEYFSIREDSEALLKSELYKILSALIAPYERF